MPVAEITIAPLVPADAANYRSVRLRALTEHPEAFRSSADQEAAKPLAWWHERLAPRDVSGVTVLGAWTADRALVGTAGLLFETHVNTRHTARVIGMYVMPEHARHGIGTRLVDALVALARSDPALEMLYLTVTSGNLGAIGLYERVGFVAYGLEPRSMRIGARTFDKLMMSLVLRPE